MRTFIKLAVTAVALGIVAVAAPANAMTVTSGAYSQTTSPLECEGGVQGDGNGGTLFVKVAGKETRSSASGNHFRTWRIYTTVYAQELTYNGLWVDVAKKNAPVGKLGRIVNNGATNSAKFVWGIAKNPNPELSVSVAGFDDTFRAKVVSNLYDDEGVLIRTLTTYEGQCQL